MGCGENCACEANKMGNDSAVEVKDDSKECCGDGSCGKDQCACEAEKKRDNSDHCC